MKFSNFLNLLFYVAIATSCAGNESSVQSLDNHAAGSRVKTNKCQGDPALRNNVAERKLVNQVVTERISWDTTKDKTNLVKSVAMSFRAVPTDMQEMFLRLGGTIMLTSKANQLCSAMHQVSDSRKSFKQAELNALSEASQKVSSCYYFMPPAVWKKLEPQGPTQQLFTIIMQDDVSEIHHNLVRTFGYIAAQVSSHIATNDRTFRRQDLVVNWTEQENATFRVYKKNVFRAFLSDLQSSNKLGRFQKYAAGRASQTETRYMEDFTYAEAFDSFFCNQYATGDYNTLNIFRKSFPRTLSAYLNPPTNSVRSGFGLTAKSKTNSGLAMWNPFKSAWRATVETYQGSKILYGEYADRRNQRIDRLTEVVTDANGGKPPTTWQTVSIAANGAYRDEAVTNNPLVGGVSKAAIDFADGTGGATIDQNGNSRVLTEAERRQKIQNGAVNTALEVAPIGEAVGFVGKRTGSLLRSGGQKLADGTVETLAKTGRTADLDTAAALMRSADKADGLVDAGARRVDQFSGAVETFKDGGIVQRTAVDTLGNGRVGGGKYTPKGYGKTKVREGVRAVAVDQAFGDSGNGPAGTYTPITSAPSSNYGVPGGQIGPASAPAYTTPSSSNYGVPGGQIGPAPAPVSTPSSSNYGVPGGQIGPPTGP